MCVTKSVSTDNNLQQLVKDRTNNVLHSSSYCHYCYYYRFDQSGSWWTKEYESEYIFPLSVDHKGLLDFIVENNFTSNVRIH